jgi:hypothetical protein
VASTGREAARRPARMWPARTRLTWLGRAGLLAAAVLSVAGCVSMPDNGPVGVFSASPQSTAQGGEDFIGSVPAGPGHGWTPSQIVQGFIDASASYPTDSAIARQYLTSPAIKTWHPGWSVTVFSQVTVPPRADLSPVGRHGGQQAVVDVTGAVQATLNGTGQYVSAQGQTEQAGHYSFILIKVNGQWRISNPPGYRMLTGTEFPQFYKAQDLYFFDLSGRVLVPDSVFVPQGASSQVLVNNLVTALIQGSKTTWLGTATATAFPEASSKFPKGTTILGVAVYGATAVVNLGGAMAGASTQVREQVSAQLVWTLAGSAASPSAIQSVELEVDGTPFRPSATPCGPIQGQSPVQKLAAYGCYDPYPPATASFYYVNGQQVWSRCGSESQVKVNSIGSVVPVFGPKGAAGGQQCARGSFVAPGSVTQPPLQPRSWLASMAAVSPDGQYVAYVSPAGNAVYTGAVAGGAASFARSSARLTGPDITAISWDRGDDLWVVQNGNVWMLPPSGIKQFVHYQFAGYVTGLSVAPDGVRVVAIVQTGTGIELDLAAIDRSGPPPPGGLRSASAHLFIGPVVQLGSDIANPAALTWYDADNLIVLDASPTGRTLWEVPVDGQSATGPLVTPPGTVSITADGTANVLVAGLSDNQLAVSTSLEGPWLDLGDPGENPTYPG